MDENYELGIILSIDKDNVRGRMIATDEPFEVPLREEFLSSLSEYMVVALNDEHTDFIYR